MAGLGSALISVGADVGQFEEDLAGAINNALSKNKFSFIMGGAAAAGVAAVIKEFLPLEKAILQIFQVQGVNATEEMFDALSNQLLDVANRVGKPAEEVGAAIALGIGRGFTQEESIDLAETASNLAVALGEDVDGAIKGVTASLNGFNLGMEDADRVSGVLFQTVAKTGVPMSQLAQQLGNLAPAARNAGISIEDAAASIATAVQQGLTAAEATTQFRTAITELSREGSDGGKVFKHISGVTFPEFIKQGHTLNDALRLIDATQAATGYSIQELTGNYNTANATLVSTGKGVELYTKNLADNKKGIEAMDAALDAANQGVLRQFQVALNDVRTGIQRIGIAFRPLIQAITAEVAPLISGLGDRLNELGVWLSTVDFTPLIRGIQWLADQFRVIGPLFVAIFDLIRGINWQQVGDAIKVAMVPVAAVIVAISSSIRALTEVIQFITPAVQMLIDVLVVLAIPLAALGGGFAAVLLAVGSLVVVFGAISKALLAFKVAALLARGAVMLLWAAFGPIGAIVLAIGVLTTAFIYAWKNSETFRNVVVSVFNNIKDVAVTAIEIIVKAILMIPRVWLEAANAVLKSLKWVPGWMGGGAVDGAQEAVQGLLNGLDSIVQGVTNVANAARRADWELNNMISSAERAAEAAAHAGLWFGNADTDRAISEALSGGGAGPRPANIPMPKLGGLDELLNPKKKDKKAADTIAKQMANLLEGVFKAVRDLAQDIGEKSIDAIQTGFENVLEKYNDAIAEAAAAGRTSVVKKLRESLKDITKFEKQLLKLAGKRDIVAERLKVAEQNLSALRQESDRFEASMKAAFVNIGSVAEASDGIGVTFRGIRNNLRDAIRTTTMFNQAITDLQRLGLNEASLRQLAEAGPEALDQARALVRSGAAGVKEINALQKQLEGNAGKVADRLADDFYNAGIASADGLVAGLQKQLPKIIKEMEKVADAMTAAVKKKLKIKSPSGVFDQEIGREIPAGAAMGVRRGIPELVKAVDAMAAAASGSGANFGPGSVAIHGVSDPAAAQRAGILAGAAIAKTLEQRRTAQVLAGL